MQVFVECVMKEPGQAETVAAADLGVGHKVVIRSFYAVLQLDYLLEALIFFIGIDQNKGVLLTRTHIRCDMRF
jgi:hypothetical protein